MGDKNHASSTKKSSSLTNANADNDNHVHEHTTVGIARAAGFHDGANNNDDDWACTTWKSTTNLKFS